MFTGLIQTIGNVVQRQPRSGGLTLEISCSFSDEPLQLDESIAVDGVCVTVERFSSATFTFSISTETLKRTNLGNKRLHEKVHLERALRLGDRLGGHIVQGHVDAVGKVVQLVPQGNGLELSILIPENLRRYVVEKGSLTVQGVSLTVAHLNQATAALAIIPATLESTCLGELSPGSQVNLEVDIIAKYVESLLAGKSTGLDQEKLRSWGF
ncbi:MAG: riboflavin synthase [bacterium]|nr:riboflavin synthase [bacterium]